MCLCQVSSAHSPSWLSTCAFPFFCVCPNVFLHKSKFNLSYLKQKILLLLPSHWLHCYPWSTQVANCLWVYASGLSVRGWYFTAQQHRPVFSKLTGVLSFPFVPDYWWEMTFVIALPLCVPLGFTLILIKVITEILIGFSSNCVG